MLAILTKIGHDLLETMTAMFNPLPAIALLPLALIWFGLGEASIVFVLVHSVVWAVALNTLSGFSSVSNTLRMVGRNYGLNIFRYITEILIPAALPSIITGLKIGWAFAWRTLIAAELVFGVSSGSGGIGWFIFDNKNNLEIANVFAGLLTVIIIVWWLRVSYSARSRTAPCGVGLQVTDNRGPSRSRRDLASVKASGVCRPGLENLMLGRSIIRQALSATLALCVIMGSAHRAGAETPRCVSPSSSAALPFPCW